MEKSNPLIRPLGAHQWKLNGLNTGIGERTIYFQNNAIELTHKPMGESERASIATRSSTATVALRTSMRVRVKRRKVPHQRNRITFNVHEHNPIYNLEPSSSSSASPCLAFPRYSGFAWYDASYFSSRTDPRRSVTRSSGPSCSSD